MTKTPQISDAEWQVMKLLWETSPLTGTQIVAFLQRESDWADLTIRTLIRRLVKKGAVCYTVDEKDSRIFYYSPAVKFGECIKIEKDSILKKISDGTASLLIASFLDDVALTDTEIDQLSAILKEKREKNV